MLSSSVSMDHLLQRELADNVVYDVSGFIDAFFPASDEIEELYRYAVRAAVYDTSRSRWTSWPASPTQQNVLAFFQDVVDNDLLKRLAIYTNCTVYRYVPSGTAVSCNSNCGRKTDLLLTTHSPSIPDLDLDPGITFSELADNRYDWKSIRVVGELRSNLNESNSETTLLQLANYARELFGSQPSRRWVHSFILCGHQLRAWLFDRSGAIGSTIIDINANPQLFLRVICGYSRMGSTAIGYDPSIKWAPGGVESVYDPSLAHEPAVPPPAYIYAPICEDNAVPVKLELMPMPIFKRTAIVTRGSVCWKARLLTDTESQASSQESTAAPYQYVVKDQWRAAERQSECEIISAMRPNVVSNQSADIPTDHYGLPWYAWYGDHHENGQAVDIHTTVRKDLMAPCRTEPDSRATETVRTVEPPATKRSTKRGKKRSPTANQSAPSSKRLRVDHSSLGNTALGCNNRVFSRIIMTPVGRSIDEFTSYPELLSAFRDAIRGKAIHSHALWFYTHLHC
jgi:hypothetical protein